MSADKRDKVKVRYLTWDTRTEESRFAISGSAGRLLPPYPMARYIEAALQALVDTEERS